MVSITILSPTFNPCDSLFKKVITDNHYLLTGIVGASLVAMGQEYLKLCNEI